MTQFGAVELLRKELAKKQDELKALRARYDRAKQAALNSERDMKALSAAAAAMGETIAAIQTAIDTLDRAAAATVAAPK